MHWMVLHPPVEPAALTGEVKFPVSGYATNRDFDDNFGLSPHFKKNSLAGRAQIF
jgi:hypothetical protein